MQEPDRATFAELGRATIRLWEWGDPGAPVVLLLHGGWDHGRMWDDFAPRVAALGYHAVAWDARGHGDSSRLPESGAAFQLFVVDLAQLAARLSPDAPVRVVGHSFGGGLTMGFSAAFPELVERAVNIDGLGPPPEMFLVQDHAAVAAQWLRDAEKLWAGPPRTYASVEEMAQKRKGINIRLPIEWCRHLAEHGTRRVEGGWTWKADPLFRLGSPSPFAEEVLLEQYRRIACPVLAITGGEPDQWADLAEADRDRRLGALPDVRHEVVAGGGHYAHIEQPEAVIALVERFFA